jgi:CRP-like cAMP-binding protein
VTADAASAADYAKTNWFLASLPPSDYAALAAHLRTIDLEQGAVLHEPGDPIEHVFFPQTGMISLVVTMMNGATVETTTIGRTGAIGVTVAFGGHRALGRALVQLPGIASRIPTSQFAAAAQKSRSIHDLAVRYNELLFELIQQSVACNALHRLRARLCRWLLQTDDNVDGNNLPLTQEFLAEMLGARRSTVTIEAAALQNAGLIRYRRGQIQIKDRAGLEKRACECYSTVRRRIDEVFPNGPRAESSKAP